jgi:hypothetical protein
MQILFVTGSDTYIYHWALNGSFAFDWLFTKQWWTYDMIWYDIYLLELGFHPVALVGKLVKKIGKRRLYTKLETVHKTIQRKHRIHKIENRHTYLLTYLLTPWSRVLLEKLTVCS